MKIKVNSGNLGLIAPSSKKQKKVDPETGEVSSAPGAISRAAFKNRQKVDPETGDLSSAPGAISRNMFNQRRKVDPVTGELSFAPGAISRSAYYNRKRQNKIVVSATVKPNLASGLNSNHYSQVQPLSSRQIGSFKKDPLPMDLDVNNDSLREKIADVNKQSIISKDAGSDNCEVQAARLV